MVMTFHENGIRTLIINLGGGMVSDLGGFVASTYMRGIQFVNIPTTLLGMVDASIGGKTGIDLNGIKNIIGTFQFAKLVLIDVEFLNSLSRKQMAAGYAEMIKHSLIDKNHEWEKISKESVWRILTVNVLLDEDRFIKVRETKDKFKYEQSIGSIEVISYTSRF